MKTNPDERLVKIALESGFWPKHQSFGNQKALQAGFKPEQTILNGPGKWWHKEVLPETPLYSIFCDSIEDLNASSKVTKAAKSKPKILGVRLRTPNIHSRFGIPIDTPEAFRRACRSIKLLPREARFGIHFHMASSNVGVGQWWHLFESMLRWCGSIEALIGR
jgi:diaminopimelate decarboxylase